MSSSTSSEESSQSNQNQDNSTQPNTYYSRKKNWVSGVDNDTILGAGVIAAGLVSAVAAYPVLRDFWNNFTQRIQQQQNGQPINSPGQNQPPYNPYNDERYIPPTEPQQQQQIVPEPAPVQEPVKEEEKQEQQQQDEDGLFHEKELKRRQQLMGRKPTGSKYESPFGRDIGGLG